MTSSTTRSTNRKRVGVLALAALLVAGVAGTGAVTTLNTSLSGNKFSAQLPASDEETVDPVGALVDVTGDPIVHTFDITQYNDTVEGIWSINNKGTVGVTFDGALKATSTNIPASLAAQLNVQYADASGTWYNAGTLAAPVSYVTAVGASSTLAAAASVKVPVRISLADPTALEGTAGATLTISAAFGVDYVAQS
jgi:hypothetical protein